MMATPAAVEVQNLTFAYDLQPVLTDVSFRVETGEMVAIVGPNGGGKTTLLRLILGLLRPSDGKVRVLGLPPVQARRRLAYVPQHSRYDARFPVGVEDVVLMGRLARSFAGFYPPAAHRAAADALAEVGIAHLRTRPFADLSGGERQRVLIARALVGEPSVLLLDEPTSNVDWAAQASLCELLSALPRTLTILMVSHDIGIVSRLVSQVVCVNRTVAMHPIIEFTGDRVSELYGETAAGVHHCHHHGGQDNAAVPD